MSGLKELDDQICSFSQEGMLLQNTVRFLDQMGDSLPKTKEKLEKVLSSAGLCVAVQDPIQALQVCHILANRPTVGVPIEKESMQYFSVGEINKSAWDSAKKQCMKHNATVILAIPGSDVGNQIQTNIESNFTQMKKSTFNNRPEIILGLVKSMKIHRKLTKVEELQNAAKEMSSTGYINVESEDGRQVVKYNLPSDFMLLCLKQLQKQYDKHTEELLEQGAHFKVDPIVQLIRSTNRGLARLKKGLGKEDLQALQISGAVDALCKKKGSDQTLMRWDRDEEFAASGSKRWSSSSPSRSRSRSKSRSRSRSRSPTWERYEYGLRIRSRRRSRSRSPRMSRSERHRSRRSTSRSHSRSRSRSMSRSESPSSLMEYDSDGDRRVPRHPYRPKKPVPSTSVLDALCDEIKKVKLEDISEIPVNLKPEMIPIITTLEKMGSSKPKTLHRFCNTIKTCCKFIYVGNVQSLAKKKSKPSEDDQYAHRKRSFEGSREKSASAKQSFQCGLVIERQNVLLTPSQFLQSDIKKGKSNKKPQGAGAPKRGNVRGRFPVRGMRGRGVYGSEPAHKTQRTNEEQGDEDNHVSSGTQQEITAFRHILYTYIGNLLQKHSAALVLKGGTMWQEAVDSLKDWMIKLSTGQASSDATMKDISEPDDMDFEEASASQAEAGETSSTMEVDVQAKPTKKLTRSHIYQQIIKRCITLGKVSPQKLVQILKDGGYVSIDKDDNVSYNLTEEMKRKAATKSRIRKIEIKNSLHLGLITHYPSEQDLAKIDTYTAKLDKFLDGKKIETDKDETDVHHSFPIQSSSSHLVHYASGYKRTRRQ